MDEDKLGAARLRDKYAGKMADGPDRRAFDLVTGGIGPNSPEFRDVARIVACGDTLNGFLRDLKTRYPELQGTLSDGVALPPLPAAPATVPGKPDPAPTGSILPRATQRLTAR